MKKLILIRHAKAIQDLNFKDFDRTIISKGIEEAHLVANDSSFLINPSFVIWSSPAKRAYETCKIFVKCWNVEQNKIVIIDNLYTFERKSLETIIFNCPDSIENLIIFGHNYALTDFANQYGDTFIENIPTSGLVLINFNNSSWQTINQGKTANVKFPRHLR